jgi:hypothetical protein
MRLNRKKQLLSLLQALRAGLSSLRPNLPPDQQRAIHEAMREDFAFILRELAGNKESPPACPSPQDLLQALETGSLPQAKALLSRLQTLLNKEPLQYKVVFFPYLSSTWDALESIYQAFARDERFITDIVIIPAHRDSPTGRINLYEDFLTGAGIPHTPYNDYDLEKDHPDIVFVSNPYDSVLDPPFHSARIRQNCHMLVYVPYYGITAGNFSKKRPEKYAEPMHLAADKLIVQSKLVAEAYNRYCPGTQGRYWPLGSPKIDACKKRSAQALDEAGPAGREWQELIAGRPVFLLDTHYRLLAFERRLPGGGRYNIAILYLSKILNHVAQRPDIFLIWRPHPLTEITITNYVKGYSDAFLNSELNALCKLAGELPNCRIDREKDFYLSFALSSALIALSNGSLKYTYLSLDKPVIYYAHNSGLPPGGERNFIDSNRICYTPTRMQIVFYFYLRLLGADLSKDAKLSAGEAGALALLSEHIRADYRALLEKYSGSKAFSAEFSQAVSRTKKSPRWGYIYEAYDQPFAFARCLSKELRLEINQFMLKLHQHCALPEIIGAVDMIARGEDPLREVQQSAYREAIANADKNCGRLVHAAVADYFFAPPQECNE